MSLVDVLALHDDTERDVRQAALILTMLSSSRSALPLTGPQFRSRAIAYRNLIRRDMIERSSASAAALAAEDPVVAALLE